MSNNPVSLTAKQAGKKLYYFSTVISVLSPFGPYNILYSFPLGTHFTLSHGQLSRHLSSLFNGLS